MKNFLHTHPDASKEDLSWMVGRAVSEAGHPNKTATAYRGYALLILRTAEKMGYPRLMSSRQFVSVARALFKEGRCPNTVRAAISVYWRYLDNDQQKAAKSDQIKIAGRDAARIRKRDNPTKTSKPMRLADYRKVMKTLNLKVFEDCMAACLITLCYETGQRFASVLALSRKDLIDCPAGGMQVRFTNGKNFAKHVGYVSPEGSAIIDRWLVMRPKGRTALFGKRAGQKLTKPSMAAIGSWLPHDCMSRNLAEGIVRKRIDPFGFTVHSPRKGRAMDLLNTEGLTMAQICTFMQMSMTTLCRYVDDESVVLEVGIKIAELTRTTALAQRELPPALIGIGGD